MALEHILHVGDYLYGFGFPSGMGGGDPGLVNNGVTDSTARIKRLREELVEWKLIGKNKVKVVAEHQDVEFRWLPWVAGKINYADHGGRDVLSGWFTGCWMVSYYEGGTRRIGHVHTQSDQTDCRATWREHMTQANVRDCKAFLPHKGLSSTFNLGLVTSTGAMHRIQLASEKTIGIPNPWPNSVEDWMAADKGKQTEQFATIFAAMPEVDAASVYGVGGYRVVKISKALSAETFPA